MRGSAQHQGQLQAIDRRLPRLLSQHLDNPTPPSIHHSPGGRVVSVFLS